MYQQSSRIIDKFGGARRLAKLLGFEPSRVYKWTYPKEKGGTDGLVPAACIRAIQSLAELEGVVLTESDWAPT
jgi:hypothetical protein